MIKRIASYYSKQPVGVRAALVAVAGAFVVACLNQVMSWMITSPPINGQLAIAEGSKIAVTFEPVPKSEINPEKGSVSLQAFAVDTRISDDLFVSFPKGFEYQLLVEGNSYPVFLSTFYNGTDEPQFLKGAELEILQWQHSAQLSAVGVEAVAAVDVQMHKGFQAFLPTILLPPGEAGAIHVRLVPSEQIEMLPFGIFRLHFSLGETTLPSPIFRWAQR